VFRFQDGWQSYYSLASRWELDENRRMRISIVIPALNEAESIGRVLAEIPGSLEADVLVVDGGSTDGTVPIAQAAGAQVIQEPRRGYGQACASGVAAARGDVIIFMDADGADDPQYLANIAAPLQEGSADLVLGSRLRGSMEAGAMPWHQYAGNWLSAFLIGLLYGLKVTDLSPFRGVYRSKMGELQMQEMTYGWPTEMIVKAAREDWRIQEVPVVYRPRLGGKSKISGTVRGTVLATYFILRTILKYWR
jgi:glycosyltransferase involved in cell wall biosynthesis